MLDGVLSALDSVCLNDDKAVAFEPCKPVFRGDLIAKMSRYPD